MLGNCRFIADSSIVFTPFAITYDLIHSSDWPDQWSHLYALIITLEFAHYHIGNILKIKRDRKIRITTYPLQVISIRAFFSHFEVYLMFNGPSAEYKMGR